MNPQESEKIPLGQNCYELALLNSPDLVSIVDKNYVYRAVSNSYLRRYGKTNSEIVGRHAAEILGEEIFEERIKPHFDRCLSGEEVRYQQWFSYPNLGERYMDVSYHPVKEGDGPVEYVTVTVRDITDFKQMEMSLRESEKKYRSLVDLISDSVYELDEHLKYTYVSNRGGLVSGRKPEDLFGKKPFDFMPEEERERVFETIKGKLDPPQSIRDFENTLIGQDGQPVFVETSAVPIYDTEERFSGYLCVDHDITERKRAEELLQQSEAKFRSLVEMTSDWIWEVDRDGFYTYVSPKIKDLLGYEPEELVGKRPFDLMSADEAKRISGIFEDLVASKDPLESLENINLHKDGREVVLETSGVPIVDAAGNIVGYRGIDRDITERKQAEEEIRNSRQQLRDLTMHLEMLREHERTKIAREVHDELGQTLAVLKMDTFWLAKNLPENLKALHDKTEAMLGLVNATIQSVKRISTELRPELLDDLGLASAIEWQAEEFQKRTGIECKPTILLHDISVDREHSTAIFRIFQEAITNIVLHAEATTVAVKLEEHDGQLALTVKDNGKGISKKEISKAGSFGLMGIRERSHALRGKMEIEGIPGKGTTMTVTIPIDRN